MTITMAIKATFHIVLMTVLLCMRSAVKVTIGDLDDIIEGSETRMMCNIKRDNPSSTADPLITWYYITLNGDKKIGSLQNGSKFITDDYMDRFDIDINNGSLVIANTLRSDSGTYQCSVNILHDIPGAGDDDVVLDVIYLETPVLMISTPMIEGEKVELICTTVANPEPVFTFKKDGANVQSSNHSTYVIQSVHRNNAGNYQCEVMNGAGTKSTTSQKLEVYYAPEISYLENKEVYRGEPVVIRFDVDANPASMYEWTTNPATTDIDSNLSTYTFIVSKTAIDIMYSVTLNASNIVGATQISINVTVVVVPTVTAPFVCTVEQGYFNGEECSSTTGPVWVREHYHRDVVHYGIIGASVGAGAVVMMVISVLIYKCACKASGKNNNQTGNSQPNGPDTVEALEMNVEKQEPPRYQAPGGELYTQVNLKDKNSEKKENIPAQVDKNVEGLTYADLDLTRNLPKDQKDTIHHLEPETMYASIQQQHSTKI